MNARLTGNGSTEHRQTVRLCCIRGSSLVPHSWQGLLGALIAEVHKVSDRYRTPLAGSMQELSLKPTDSLGVHHEDQGPQQLPQFQPMRMG